MRGKLLIIVGTASCLTMAACVSSPATNSSQDDSALLVSSEQRDGESGPEASFKGVLIMSEDNCVQGRAEDGNLFNVEFPAGTHFDDEGDIDMGFATVPVGEEVFLGGGYSEDPSLVDSLPESCRTGTTFQVYSI